MSSEQFLRFTVRTIFLFGVPVALMYAGFHPKFVGFIFFVGLGIWVVSALKNRHNKDEAAKSDDANQPPVE